MTAQPEETSRVVANSKISAVFIVVPLRFSKKWRTPAGGKSRVRPITLVWMLQNVLERAEIVCCSEDYKNNVVPPGS